jgi:hypothetical protein
MKAAGMADTLAQCLGDDATLRRTGLAGREFAERRHSWPVIVDAMMEFYGWLVGGGARPDCVLS